MLSWFWHIEYKYIILGWFGCWWNYQKPSCWYGGNWRIKKPNNLHVDLEKSRSVGFVMQARITCVCMIGGEGGGYICLSISFQPIFVLQKKEWLTNEVHVYKSEGWFAINNGDGCVGL